LLCPFVSPFSVNPFGKMWLREGGEVSDKAVNWVRLGGDRKRWKGDSDSEQNGRREAVGQTGDP
jgi:hypothetical protein